MKYFAVFISIFLLVVSPIKIIGQPEGEVFTSGSSVQYGVSLNILMEWNFSSEKGNKKVKNPVFSLSVNSGIGTNMLASEIYPAFNTEIRIYNGGLGSAKSSFPHPKISVDIITALTLTVGHNNRLNLSKGASRVNDNIPLYYFSNFVFPSLRNPFDYSFSLGTNLILTPADSDKSWQRVGFLNIHLKDFQFSHYNDGTPFNKLLADKKDRYYTGGAIISYQLKYEGTINLIELAFHKFTGYSKNAFEMANKLDFSYVDYKEPKQQYYNRSLWMLKVANLDSGLGFSIENYNKVKWDVQHAIHTANIDAYHISPYKRFWAVSPSYFYSFTKVGLR